MPGSEEGPEPTRGFAWSTPLFWLVLLSLSLRAAAWAWVVANGVPPLYDEVGYLERAEGWRQILLACVHFEQIPSGALDTAYGQGRWPPLHPMLLGVMLALGGGVAAARAVGVLFGVLSTVLVFRLGERLGGRRVGVVAAALHALAPSFIAYSHYLWAETLAVLLALAAVLRAVSTEEALDENRRWRRSAVLCGVWLGLAILTRVALLPWLFVLPCWWLLAGIRPEAEGPSRRESMRRRGVAAGLCMATAIMVAAPWQMALAHREGRFVPFSTLGGYNLALGNHAKVPAEYGSSWGHESSKAWLHGELRRQGEILGVAWERAAAPLAWQEIRQRPWAAVSRIPTRLWLLWAPDVFPCRHLFSVVYPPLTSAATVLLAASILAVHLLILGGAVYGFLRGRWRHRLLIGLLMAAAMVPPAATIALTRLQLPLEALLLPAVASALLSGRRMLSLRALGTALLISLASLWALPRVIDLYWIPSSHHAPILESWAGRLGASPVYSDRLELERGEIRGELRLALTAPAPGVRLAPLPAHLLTETGEVRWPARLGELTVDVFSSGNASWHVEIRQPAGQVLAGWRPVTPTQWRRWVPLTSPVPSSVVPAAEAGDESPGAESPEAQSPEAESPEGAGVRGRWLGGGRSPR